MAGEGGMQDLVSETKPGRARVKFHIRLGCLLLILRIQLPLIMQGEHVVIIGAAFFFCNAEPLEQP